MHINDMFPSQYLKAADILGKKVKVEIENVTREEMQDGALKPVISFVGKDKGLVLNRINAETIAATLGGNTETWQGAVLVLHTQKVQGPQGIVDGIRIMDTQPSPRATDPRSYGPDHEAEQSADFDDDIPF